jgi:hypothetical protein
MPTYDVYVWTKYRRLKYPRGMNIPSLTHRIHQSLLQ